MLKITVESVNHDGARDVMTHETENLSLDCTATEMVDSIISLCIAQGYMIKSIIESLENAVDRLRQEYNIDAGTETDDEIQ